MTRRRRKAIFVHALLVPSALLFVLPVAWGLLMSLRPTPVITSGLNSVISAELTTANYADLFSRYNVARYLLNSLIASVLPMLIAVTVGLLAAYSVVRFKYPGVSAFYALPLFAQIVPHIQILIPIYSIMLALSLLNTYAAIILAHTAMVLPFAVWMLTGYLRGVPAEIEEAAMVDGCSRLGAIYRIVLPIAMPGVVATGLVAFLTAWGDFLFGFTLLSGEPMRLISIAIYFFMPGQQTPATWGTLFAAAAVYMLPALVLFLVLQQLIAKGLSLGSVQG